MRSRRFFIPKCLFAAIFALACNAYAASAELTIESYCQISIESLRQEILNYRELIALVNQYKDNPQTLALQEKVRRVQLDKARRDLYASFGTTGDEYIAYMGKNPRALDLFLDQHPEIKQEIQNLSGQARTLMEEYESLREKQP